MNSTETEDPLMIVRKFLTQTLGYPKSDFTVGSIDNALRQRAAMLRELKACQIFIRKYGAIPTADETRERLMRLDVFAEQLASISGVASDWVE